MRKLNCGSFFPLKLEFFARFGFKQLEITTLGSPKGRQGKVKTTTAYCRKKKD
jgi:hypothetical protein